MGKPQRRKKVHFGDTHLARRWRTRSRKRDLDQIDDDMKNKAEELIDQPVDLEKPGFAQHYCIHCAKYFIDEHSINEHYRTKVHKRRMKALELEPYSHAEADRAAGMGCYVEPLKRKLATQPTKAQMKAGAKLVLEVVEKEDANDMKE